MIELRPYQAESVGRTLDTTEKIIECSPTGSGKTIIQAFVCKEGMDLGVETAILTPRAEIFNQTHSALNEICGAENVATLRSGQPWNSYKPIHVVSWPTLIARMRRGNDDMPRVQRVLVDEVHLALAPKIGEILDYYSDKAHVVGYSATPARQSGKGLGTYFSRINVVRSVRELIAEGFLVPLEYWGGALPDLQGIATVAGDFQKRTLSERCAVLVGDVVDNWLRLASDRHTIVFAVDIAHAESLRARFLELGVACTCIHNKLSIERREEEVARFKSGQIQVLVNVMIASYGFDDPEVNCIVAARPTQSIVLWLQMLGRGMRPMAGKTACMVLDHADNTRRLGMAEDSYRWSLDVGKKVYKVLSQKKLEEIQHTTLCKSCNYLFSGTRICPECGWEKPFQKLDVSTVEADLVLIGAQRFNKLPDGFPTHEVFFRMLLGYCKKHHHKVGWAAYKFKDKCGGWPPNHFKYMVSMEPDQRVSNWIRGQQIRYAKRQEKQRAKT